MFQNLVVIPELHCAHRVRKYQACQHVINNFLILFIFKLRTSRSGSLSLTNPHPSFSHCIPEEDTNSHQVLRHHRQDVLSTSLDLQTHALIVLFAIIISSIFTAVLYDRAQI